jgi:hypothetical protein
MKTSTLSCLILAHAFTARVSEAKDEINKEMKAKGGVDQRALFSCPNISTLELECNVKDIGKLDPFGNYEISQGTIVVTTTQSAQCASTMHFQVLENSDIDFFLSCASGYQKACNTKMCQQAFIKCKADREGGSQYLEGIWKVGEETMDVMNFGRGDIPSSWFSRCNIIGSTVSTSSVQIKNPSALVPYPPNDIKAIKGPESQGRDLEIVPSISFPNISTLELECNVKGVGMLDPFGKYNVSPTTFTLTIANSALCVSVMHFHNSALGSKTDFFLSCVSGYQRQCTPNSADECSRAFLKCQAEWEGGNQFLEGNWKAGDTQMDVLSIFGRGAMLGSWSSSCKIRGMKTSRAPFQLSASKDTDKEGKDSDIFSCQNVSPLVLDCDVAAVGDVSSKTITITTTQSEHCTSVLHVQNMETETEFYLSCVSGFVRACNKRRLLYLG